MDMFGFRWAGLLEMGFVEVAFGTFSPASTKCSICRMRRIMISSKIGSALLRGMTFRKIFTKDASPGDMYQV
jgi:hypothetical protein